MQHNIYILTGAIQTGKTTALLKFCSEKKHVQGILTPLVNGRRMFMDIASKEMFEMEADENEAAILKIGRFTFKAAAFKQAEQIIIDSSNYNYLVIDEIGPLELRKEGLYTVIQESFQKQSNHIILVVRQGLVDKVIKCFTIKNPVIITKTTLESI